MKIVTKSFSELTTDELYEILRIRAEIFVVEQDCVYQDVDGLDRFSHHLYIEEDGVIAAYLRLVAPGKKYDEPSVGRVVSRVRRKGYATTLIKEALTLSKKLYGTASNRISGQLYARSLYEKIGYKQVSDVYLEDDIDHIEMLYTE